MECSFVRQQSFATLHFGLLNLMTLTARVLHFLLSSPNLISIQLTRLTALTNLEIQEMLPQRPPH